MKKIMVLLKKPFALVMICALLSMALIAAVPVDDVYAEIESEPEFMLTDEHEESGVYRFFYGLLSRTFFYQKHMVDYLDQNVEQADNVAANAQLRIVELEDEGKDVAALETALDTFYDLVADAEQALDAANGSISLHKGFDEDSKVSDLTLARDTIKELEGYISTARDSIIEAVRAIVDGMQEYRDINQPVEE
ncbi:MAG TPA: hypothetical protein G4N92_10065 [Anaerolineae bacterium]|nr:hypothetical protein [Anaerolineae bacterium]